MSEVITLLKKLLTFKSITPNDDGALDFIQNFMNDFQFLYINKNKTKNLFLYKQFNNHYDKSLHLNFTCHIDVVPAIGTWNSDPFTPLEKGGFIFARGAQDMKGGLAAALIALKKYQNNDSKGRLGQLSMLITSDEEGHGIDGVPMALKQLETKNLLPNYSIVTEPTSLEYFGDNIKIGRRGSIHGTLIIKGTSGHAAYQHNCINPIHLMAPFLANFAGYRLDEGDQYFEPSQITIVDIKAGDEISNVTPESIKIMFNVRNSILTDQQQLRDFTESLLAKYNIQDFDLSLRQSATAFITKDTKIKNIMQTIIREAYGIQAKCSCDGGTSDARHLAKYNIPVIEFGTCNNTLHQVNECVRIDEVEKLQVVYEKFIYKINESV